MINSQPTRMQLPKPIPEHEIANELQGIMDGESIPGTEQLDHQEMVNSHFTFTESPELTQDLVWLVVQVCPPDPIGEYQPSTPSCI